MNNTKVSLQLRQAERTYSTTSLGSYLLEQLLDSLGELSLKNDFALNDVEDLARWNTSRPVVLVHFVGLEPKVDSVEQDIGQEIVEG